VPVQLGGATQLITVEASGSYATVTAWAKEPAGWKAQFSTTAGRVGANGVTNGATRKQNTSTTPSGTYPITEYAEVLVVDFNRRPATPGRGAGIFLHVNGAGATAGCVSVPRATMDRIMAWISPSAHPRIAIG
jgi:L,D-peptidoglycan transpeptidase YkuD (ErfK/YbiS/YcfS/YnhG family)